MNILSSATGRWGVEANVAINLAPKLCLRCVSFTKLMKNVNREYLNVKEVMFLRYAGCYDRTPFATQFGSSSFSSTHCQPPIYMHKKRVYPLRPKSPVSQSRTPTNTTPLSSHTISRRFSFISVSSECRTSIFVYQHPNLLNSPQPTPSPAKPPPTDD